MTVTEDYVQNATITQNIVDSVSTDDPGNATHIVMIPPHLRGTITPVAYVLEARIEGRQIEALCGHRWVPQRDPKAYPICEGCLHIYKTQGNDLDKRDGLPPA